MLKIDDKDPTPVQARQMWGGRKYRPVHERLRIYTISGPNRERKPLWRWRGIHFKHNKRRRPQ